LYALLKPPFDARDLFRAFLKFFTGLFSVGDPVLGNSGANISHGTSHTIPFPSVRPDFFSFLVLNLGIFRLACKVDSRHLYLETSAASSPFPLDFFEHLSFDPIVFSLK